MSDLLSVVGTVFAAIMAIVGFNIFKDHRDKKEYLDALREGKLHERRETLDKEIERTKKEHADVIKDYEADLKRRLDAKLPTDN